MLPVSDLARSLVFYRQYFSFVELRRIELTSPARTLVFIGTESEPGSAYSEGSAMQLELWYEPARQTPPPATQHAPSTLRAHVGIAVSGIDGFVDRLAAAGVPVLQRPAALRPGGRRLAMIADPDGHEIELLEVL
ncbi:MAG: VOC family protein [Gammaproteobacteria bacterium]|nr:VOC family protein [Gammaproteobacteria bacterium]